MGLKFRSYVLDNKNMAAYGIYSIKKFQNSISLLGRYYDSKKKRNSRLPVKLYLEASFFSP